MSVKLSLPKAGCYNCPAMDSMAAIIPVRSRRQAMDWSLVLMSQGIECRIEPENAEHGWQLALDAQHYTRALESLRLYKQENQKQIWSQTEPWTGLVFDWRALGWYLMLACIFLVEQMRHGYLHEAGLMVSGKVAQGEWWRLFTATMLHANLPHLLSNVTIGAIFLGLAMGIFGSGPALLASFLAGVGGNLAGYIFYASTFKGLGASGMVMGSLGLLAVHSVWQGRGGAQRSARPTTDGGQGSAGPTSDGAHRSAGPTSDGAQRSAGPTDAAQRSAGPTDAAQRSAGATTVTSRQLRLRGFVAGIFLLILLGTDQHSDVLAHCAGFVWGAMFGSLLALVPIGLLRNRAVNWCTEVGTFAMALLVWWQALRG